MVTTLTAQVLVTSSYANAKEVSYYRVNGADASLVGANYALMDFGNTYCVRASEAAFVDPRSPLSGGTAGLEWGFPGANEWVDHYMFPFDLSTWTQGNTPVITGGLSDPFGGNNASVIEDNDASTIESVSQNTDVNMRLGQHIRATIYLGKQADEGSFPEFQFRDSSLTLTYYVDVNKNTGATAVRSNSGWTTISHSLTSFSDEWWKLQVVGVSSVTNPFRLSVIPAVGTSLGSASVSATGSLKVYIDTVETDNAWKDVNQTRVFSDGGVFIETERTNLVEFSSEKEEWTRWSSTDITTSLEAPDGIQNSDGAIYPGSVGAAIGESNISMSNDIIVAPSVYARPTSGSYGMRLNFRANTGGQTSEDVTTSDSQFTRYQFASTIDVGSGSSTTWFRFVDPTGVSSSHALWNLQVEEGFHVSSPIRTSGSIATRATDYVRIENRYLSEELRSGHFKIRFIPTFDATVDTAGATTKYVFAFDGTPSQGIRFRSTGAQWQMYCVNDTGTMTFIINQTLGGGLFDIWKAGDIVEIETNHRTGEMIFRNISKGTEQSDTDVAAAGGSFTVTDDLIVGGGNGAVNFIDAVILPPEAVT